MAESEFRNLALASQFPPAGSEESVPLPFKNNPFAGSDQPVPLSRPDIPMTMLPILKCSPTSVLKFSPTAGQLRNFPVYLPVCGCLYSLSLL